MTNNITLHKQFRLSLAGKKEADGTVWNEIAYVGQWSGHPSGNFQFTSEIFNQLVKNSTRRKDAMPVRHGHHDPHDPIASQMAEYLGQAGWIQELKVEKNEEGKQALFGRMKWTDRTASKIEADEFRHCSVVVTFNGIDEVSGENIGAELIELGIVGAAFLTDMTPLAASRAGRKHTRALAQNKDPKLELNEIIKRAQKELPEGFTRDQLVAFIDAEEQKAAAIAGAESDEAPAKEPEVDDVAAGNETPADTVDLEAEPGAEPGAVEDEGDAMVLDTIKGFAEQAGMDVPALLAIIQERLPALLDTPEDGGVSDDPAAMGKYADGLAMKLGASEVKCGQLVQERDAVNDKLVRLQFEKDVDLALFERKITDAVKVELLELHAEAPTFACKRLSAAMGEKGTVVPVGKVRNEGTPSDAGDIDSSAPTREEAIAQAEETLRLKAASEGTTLRTKDLRSQSYELAKATNPDAFGIKTSA